MTSGRTPTRLSPEIQERPGWLLNDREDEIAHVGQLIADLQGRKGNLVDPQSSRGRAARKKVAQHAGKLADLLQESSTELWSSDIDRLREIVRQHSGTPSRTSGASGRGKSNMMGHAIAARLCYLIGTGKIGIEPRTTPNSDLAKLMRLCCEAVGFKGPQNVAHYLKPTVDALKVFERSGLSFSDDDALFWALTTRKFERSIEEILESALNVRKGR